MNRVFEIYGFSGLISIGAVLMLLFSFEEGVLNRVNIVIEAEMSNTITYPMEIVKGSKASGGAYIQIREGIGRGWLKEAGGEAVYYFKIELPDEYTFWARTKWVDGCSNAFYLQMDDSPLYVFGNDAVFGNWHWVKGVCFPLAQGVHTLTISNHSDDIKVDKVLLTNDPNYRPQERGEKMTSFYDGFAGCDADNTGSWISVGGNWLIIDPTGADGSGISASYVEVSGEEAKSLAGSVDWENYSYQVLAMAAGRGTIGIFFYYQNEGNYYLFRWAADDFQSGITRKQVLRVVNGITTIIGETPGGYQPDQWYEMKAVANHGHLQIWLDREKVFDLYDHGLSSGKIGVYTAGNEGAYFDNVEVLFLGMSEVDNS